MRKIESEASSAVSYSRGIRDFECALNWGYKLNIAGKASDVNIGVILKLGTGRVVL